MKKLREILSIILIFSLNSSLASISETCSEEGRRISRLSEEGLYHYHFQGYELFINYNHPSLKVGTQLFLSSIKALLDKMGLEGEAPLANLRLLRNNLDELADVPFKIQYSQEPSNLTLKKTEKFLPLACLSVLKLTQCQKSIHFLRKELNPRRLDGTSNEIILGDLMHKVLNSQKHKKILFLLAKDLINTSIGYLEFNIIPKEDIYSKTFSIAKKQGLSDTQAAQATLELLAVYAIRGAAYFSSSEEEYSFFEQLTKSKQGFSLLVLSTAISFLDKAQFFHTNSLFSLPGQYLSTTCHYGKPYRFWMSAYLSYIANKKGKFSPKISFLASHLSGIAYELSTHSKPFNGRKEHFEKIVESKERSSLDIISAKMSVLFTDLGAGFGIYHNKKFSINGDKLLKRSLKSGRVPFVKVHPYATWMSLIAPHTNLKYFFR